jgi:hypothetical protein
MRKHSDSKYSLLFTQKTHPTPEFPAVLLKIRRVSQSNLRFDKTSARLWSAAARRRFSENTKIHPCEIFPPVQTKTHPTPEFPAVLLKIRRVSQSNLRFDKTSARLWSAAA